MGERALQFYQGSDWLTYRWSVAQLFDTLDRMREVCNHAPIKLSSPAGTQGAPMPRYEMTDDEVMADIFGCMIELCDDIAGELDAVIADIFPSMQNPTVQRWMGFEMQMHLHTLRQSAMCHHQALEPSPTAIDGLMDTVNRLRDLLKHIDQ